MKKLVFSLIFILSAFAVFSQTTPKKITKTKVVEPIYSIFQSAEQEKIKREDSLGKTQIQCAPPLPKVRSDDIIFAKRITRDIYFADPANRYMVPSVMDRNLISILVGGINSHEITAYQTYDASINKLLEPVNDDPNALKTLKQFFLAEGIDEKLINTINIHCDYGHGSTYIIYTVYVEGRENPIKVFDSGDLIK